MGSRIDDIESEVSQKRRRVKDEVTGLRARAENDVTSVQAEAQARVDKIVGEAKDALHDAGEKVELEDRMRNHPYPMLAAGVGAGALLGFVTGGGSDARHEEHKGEGGDSPGLLSSLLGPIASTAGEKLRTEIQGIVRDRVGEFVESVKSDNARGTAGADIQV